MSSWLFWGKRSNCENSSFWLILRFWKCLSEVKSTLQLNSPSSLERYMYEDYVWYMLSVFQDNLPLRVHGQFISNTLGRVQATWLGSAKLFWCVNIVNKLHGVVATRGLRKESMPVCFLGASLSFILGSCWVFHLRPVELEVWPRGSEFASWLEPDN